MVKIGERQFLLQHNEPLNLSDIPWCCNNSSVKTIVVSNNKVFFMKDDQEAAKKWRERLPPFIQYTCNNLPGLWMIEYDSTAKTFTLIPTM